MNVENLCFIWKLPKSINFQSHVVCRNVCTLCFLMSPLVLFKSSSLLLLSLVHCTPSLPLMPPTCHMPLFCMPAEHHPLNLLAHVAFSFFTYLVAPTTCWHSLCLPSHCMHLTYIVTNIKNILIYLCCIQPSNFCISKMHAFLVILPYHVCLENFQLNIP